MAKHIKEIYDRGLLPAAAYREVLRQLKTECKNNLEYHKKLSDRSQAPRRNDFYREYKKERFGCGSLPTMFLALQDRIKFLQEIKRMKITSSVSKSLMKLKIAQSSWS